MGQGDGAGAGDRGVEHPDALVARLDQQAEDMMAEDLAQQDRWQAFVEANRVVIGDLSMAGVLTRIAEAARALVGARYAAIGVHGRGGGFEQFIPVGMDEDEVARIGHLPEGKGLLGVLIDDPSPLRLPDLRDDPRSVGVPGGHPVMRGFLGVPIRVGDEVFGTLYLASPTPGDFDAEDEQLVLGLAATAGVAIDNARLYEEARHRQEWLEASTAMTRHVLTSPGADALRLIAQRVEELADADVVSVAVPVAEAGEFRVVVAVGDGEDELVDFRYSLAGTIGERVLATGRAEVFEDVRTLEPPSPPVKVAQIVALGPVMIVPLSGTEGVRGVLVVGRRPERRAFAAGEVEMATNFAYHASVALELADARREAQRMAVLEDRARIARDLHDHVIQQLFAAGMTLQASLPRLGPGPAGESVDRVVDIIDDAIRQIRASVFQLRPTRLLGGESLRAAVLGVVSEATPSLGWEPPVVFAGAVDSVSDAALLDDVLAVVRESLSNVARHARAQHAEVLVAVRGPLLEVVVEDDGVGIDESERRSGLGNLGQRAEARSGRFEAGPGTDGRGTRITWTVPFHGHTAEQTAPEQITEEQTDGESAAE